MKNLFITALTFLFLTSCHNDDDAKTPELLPKSGSDTFEDGEIVNANFEFDGKTINRINWDDNSYEDYTYENGKIKYINQYIEGDLVIKKTLEYEADKLVTVTADDLDILQRKVVKYTYDSNNTVSIKEYDLDLEEEDTTLYLNATAELTLSNGNITKLVRKYSEGPVETHTYTFDNKNGPYKNVSGFEIMKFAELEGGVNNYLTHTFAGDEQNFTAVYTNTYNTQGYLIKSVGSTSGQVNTSTFDYFEFE